MVARQIARLGTLLEAPRPAPGVGATVDGLPLARPRAPGLGGRWRGSDVEWRGPKGEGSRGHGSMSVAIVIRRLGPSDEGILGELAVRHAAFDLDGRGGRHEPLGPEDARAYLAHSGVLHWIAGDGDDLLGFLLCLSGARTAAFTGSSAVAGSERSPSASPGASRATRTNPSVWRRATGQAARRTGDCEPPPGGRPLGPSPGRTRDDLRGPGLTYIHMGIR